MTSGGYVLHVLDIFRFPLKIINLLLLAIERLQMLYRDLFALTKLHQFQALSHLEKRLYTYFANLRVTL